MKTILITLLLAVSFSGTTSAQQAKLTSILQVLDVGSASIRVIKEFPYRIEAPFWTKDGTALIYNSGGRLNRIRTNGSSTPEMIPTGFADHCNNDHVLSPDGTEIGLSHGTASDGKSRIYVVPASGGQPQLITADGPSYLHGWSPDGKTLTYCAERSGNFDVYAISAKGGKEIRLTDAPGLDDGPEYTPDGKYIWFNSVRTGVMQLWRMKTDGTAQTPMTSDEDVYSWFPHVSPNGRQVVYLVYHRGDVAADQHLADKNVAIRIMPATGGKSRTLAAFLGGQGTMNVNSWSPDSKKIAFVSYRMNK